MTTDPQTTNLCADPAYSTRPEGHAAHGDGKQYRDCPYIRGEDRWAWEQGWIQAEHEQRQRIAGNAMTETPREQTTLPDRSGITS